MGRDRLVEPEAVPITISDGNYILVRKRLNHGEYEDYLARIYPFQTPGEPVRMETRQIRTSKVVAYLVGWDLTHRGKPIPMSPDMPDQEKLDTVNSLDRDTFREIYQAIDAHETKAETEAAARKNGSDGGSASPAISPSPESVTGDTSGSVN